jgi:hypothetical protein
MPKSNFFKEDLILWKIKIPNIAIGQAYILGSGSG